mmetsp:Transcript_4507/g.5580  ORF Transcript_4507/g.5580 Transcript_4507/m.5580 type:complete len:299 (-) Transcript_4507:701-1597(-)|eukprot:CAMPEP_0184006268 /NCGR_PEP_ID=MMETSP0954-20121128/574_1 /TAXON_ID=627963 /ORGANISM="Aplanochytrium sp, Strain PBS07" /LENGTH=298 /DNA_ID=CAMNT_0026284749 /DNA_START=119 /DNA_END=1015 /DNA_ORIENTATION=-
MSTGNARPQNPAVRRIMADIRELEHSPSAQYAARPLECNMFEWHFVIRGPKDSDYEGGVYHGRIVLPRDYPFKPPSIMFFTPNGRWEIKQKICLSISSYHPEQWQPAWGIRTILEAIISFMVAPGEGAVGALDCSPELRRKLAKESQTYSHPLMPELPPESSAEEIKPEVQEKYAKQIAQMHIHKFVETGDSESKENLSIGVDKTDTDEVGECTSVKEGKTNELDHITSKPSTSQEPEVIREEVREVESSSRNSATAPIRSRSSRPSDPVDSFLYYLSIALMMAIFAILYRQALKLYA